MASRDNGMLNARFLQRCKRIGYRHPNTILTHWKDQHTWDDSSRKFENSGGMLLPYWCLSSFEQTRVDRQVLVEQGYVYHVEMADGPRAARKVLETLLANQHVLKPWTQLYFSGSWTEEFFFTDDTDAVLFRLSG